jgi:hypothetical protein
MEKPSRNAKRAVQPEFFADRLAYRFIGVRRV